jgi:hypothetical protein
MKHHTHQESACLTLPRLERVKYFYGQLLGVREFQSEQSYFLEKHRLHNRYLHGYGVVCGLRVDPCKEPEPPCPEPKTKEPELCVELDCGLALDCQGNEIVVPAPMRIDLLQNVTCEVREQLLAGKKAYLSLCFVERPLEPVRPLTTDSCGGLLPDCVPSRVRDDFCIRIALECPPHDQSCSACERPCCEPCLPLAALHWEKGKLHVDNGIRRTLAPYVPTRVSGVSWVHGASYAAEHADAMLREGLVIEFSDGVHTSTLRRGVLDVWIVQGGGGRHGDIYNVGVDVLPSDPKAEFSRRVTARLQGQHRDRIDPRDRVLVQLRSAFVLDRCCRPLDGDHVGGLVPVLSDYSTRWGCNEAPEPAPCRRPEPRTFAPWSSGNGTPGGSFESWFYVSDDYQDHQKA